MLLLVVGMLETKKVKNRNKQPVWRTNKNNQIQTNQSRKIRNAASSAIVNYSQPSGKLADANVITYSASFIGCRSNMTVSTTTRRRDGKKHEKKWSAPRNTWAPHSNASTQTLNMHRVAKGLILTLKPVAEHTSHYCAAFLINWGDEIAVSF